MKNIRIFLKKEFGNIGRFEALLYIVSIFTIVFVSFYLKNSKIAALSAFFGISYTILAGKGKIYCYFFGLISSLLYSYLAFKNSFFGNFILNFFYYLPAQIIGIFLWKKHLKKESFEIIKRKLNIKNKVLIFTFAILLSVIAGLILDNFGNMAYFDAICLIFSIFAMFLTVKRCIEQWYFWTVVNASCVVMWLNACLNGSNCHAIVIMWLVYLVLGIYFLKKWRKEMIK